MQQFTKEQVIWILVLLLTLVLMWYWYNSSSDEEIEIREVPQSQQENFGCMSCMGGM